MYIQQKDSNVQQIITIRLVSKKKKSRFKITFRLHLQLQECKLTNAPSVTNP